MGGIKQNGTFIAEKGVKIDGVLYDKGVKLNGNYIAEFAKPIVKLATSITAAQTNFSTLIPNLNMTIAFNRVVIVCKPGGWDIAMNSSQRMETPYLADHYESSYGVMEYPMPENKTNTASLILGNNFDNTNIEYIRINFASNWYYHYNVNTSYTKWVRFRKTNGLINYMIEGGNGQWQHVSDNVKVQVGAWTMPHGVGIISSFKIVGNNIYLGNQSAAVSDKYHFSMTGICEVWGTQP